jgi:hypothetical protein
MKAPGVVSSQRGPGFQQKPFGFGLQFKQAPSEQAVGQPTAQKKHRRTFE